MSATNVSNPSSVSKNTATAGTESVWDIDSSHAAAHFKVRHMMVAYVRGTLGPVSGTVTLDEKDVTRSRVDVSIDTRGIETRDAKRDEHLRSADFLDVANHPTLTFVSRQVTKDKDGHLQVVGDLTIRGTTKAVTLTVDALEPAIADPWGNTKRGASARTTINRKDWGLEWNVALEAGGVLVAEQVAIEIEIELVKRKS
jgi:polyisoprenoid-binding protein YceI